MSEPLEDVDLADIHLPGFVTAAAFLLMAAGLGSAASGVQLLLVLKIFGLMKAMPPFLLLTGIVAMYFGGMLSRGRLWASIGGAVLAVVMGLAGMVWVLWALMYGFFAPLPLLSAFGSIFAAMVVPLTILPTKRYSEARAKLMA